MTSTKEILNMDIRYPGIDIKVELTVLQAYLSQMEHGIKSVAENYIQQEMTHYKDSEYYEYQHIDRIAEDEMPRIIRMPFIVTICALFENSVVRLLNYAKDKEKQELAFKDINGKTPINTYNKYMSHILKYQYQFNNETSQEIGRIHVIRNYVAHCNGNINLLSDDKIRELEKISTQTKGLKIESDTIDISYEYLENSMRTVEATLRDLMNYMETRYGFYPKKHYVK